MEADHQEGWRLTNRRSQFLLIGTVKETYDTANKNYYKFENVDMWLETVMTRQKGLKDNAMEHEALGKKTWLGVSKKYDAWAA